MFAKRVVHELTTTVTIDAMQQMAGDINKIRRSLSVTMLHHRLVLRQIAGDQMQIASKNWLCPPDPSKNYNIGCKAHQDGTATWFLQGNVFDGWNAKGSFLWIHGKRMLSKIALAMTLIPFA